MAQPQAEGGSSKIGQDVTTVPASFDSGQYGGSDADLTAPGRNDRIPERELWLSVIWQAVSDCRARNGSSSSGAAAIPSDRAAAWRLLTDRRGAWAQSRVTICTMAAICPNALRDAMEAESASWPPLPNDYAEPTEADAPSKGGRPRLRCDDPELQARRERDRERAREAYQRRKQQAQQAASTAKPYTLPRESRTTRALLAGTGMTFPTFSD